LKTILIIGGAGFIGTNAAYFFSKKKYNIIVLDKLTYSGNKSNLNQLIKNNKIIFKRNDLNNYRYLKNLLSNYKPDYVLNFAAESHVDRSIDGPANFFYSNISGVFTLLETLREYKNQNKKNIYFLQISTDEVYGSAKKSSFRENSTINPSSPYSATKASADSMVQGWCRTFNIDYNITRCTNNFGPYQYPEKLIPLTIYRSLNLKNIEIYGRGKNIRDWIYVDDHINAIYQILKFGKKNEIYNIGGGKELSNNLIVEKIIKILSRLKKKNLIDSYSDKIIYVKDRPAHDFRYSVMFNKIKKDTKWKIESNFDTRLEETIFWYIKNYSWMKKSLSSFYRGTRLGL